jgi:hypothetical protein
MLKVHILTGCSHCNGEAYLTIGEGEDSKLVNEQGSLADSHSKNRRRFLPPLPGGLDL